MTKAILHIDCSPGSPSMSYSRQASAALVAALADPDDEVVYRDLAQAAPPHIDGALRAGWTAEADQRSSAQVEVVTRSEGLIAELKRADIVVIGSPMYNFTVPSTLKAWIDHVAIAGQTFRYTATGPEGLLSGKRAYLALASGGVYSHGPFVGVEHLETYLRAILGFLGIRQVDVVRVEGSAYGPDAARDALAGAIAQAEALGRARVTA